MRRLLWSTANKSSLIPALLPALLMASCVALGQNHPATDRSSRPPSDQTNKAPGQSANPTVSLTISAAASLQNALLEIEPLFEARYPDVDIFYNWGGSGTLQRQIEQGAPADLFFSASPMQMAALAQQKRVDVRSQQTLLTNQLVLIAPLDSSLTKLEDLAQLSGSQKIAVGEFRSVPAGQYAQATLEHLQLLPKLKDRLVFFNNVRGVLSAVESGHIEAGFVYATDARLSKRVKVIAIAPPASHQPIEYPIAALQQSDHPQAARQYIDFLSDPAAIAIFQRFGFLTE
ncbi:MAG: molybdate ABC transporter substrate-binding protein [Phormidesmis sp.]